jgi:raffinose/stachyose/melibiose transport system substrate-binding protein
VKHLLNPSFSLSVNAHSSSANQAAARRFVDFLARPRQNALYTQLVGGLTQYDLLKGRLPAYMSPLSTVVSSHLYVVSPIQGWWNANVLVALQEGIGLLTGQITIDGILGAMDAAWKLGPA